MRLTISIFQILKFEARMDSTIPADTLRRLVVTYYLSDGTISVHDQDKEMGVGDIGKTFLRRTRVRKPTSTPEEPEYYKPEDFQHGRHPHTQLQIKFSLC